jgi:hypothetical protein
MHSQHNIFTAITGVTAYDNIFTAIVTAYDTYDKGSMLRELSETNPKPGPY